MNLADSLFEDLRSSDPSIRYSILNRIESASCRSDQIDAFRKLIESETDPGTRIHMEMVLNCLTNVPGASPIVKTTLADLEKLLKQPDQDFLTIALSLKNLDPREIPLSLEIFRKIGLSNFPEEVLPFILQIFKNYGSTADTYAIEEFCRHPNPRVLMAAIEALEKVNPEDLKAFVVPLLINSSPGIQSLAVRLLYRWDPKEALHHFRAMLFSENFSEKQAALAIAYFFPFQLIEALMLKFLGLEENAELVTKAGVLFIINPDQKLLFNLADIFEACIGQKKNSIKKVILGVVDSLSKAGIVQKSKDEIFSEIREEYRLRKTEQILERLTDLIQSPQEENRKIAIEKLGSLIKIGVTRASEILSKRIDLESNGMLRDMMKSVLEGSLEAISQPDADYFSSLNNFSAEDFKRFKTKILEDFPRAPFSVKEQMMQIYALHEGDVESAFFKMCLDFTEKNVLLAAIEIFSQLIPETFSNSTSKLLTNPDFEVQVAVIQGIALNKKKEAFEISEQFLFSVQPLRRKVGILALSSFDFPSSRELLLKSLGIEEEPDNIQKTFQILRLHIDEELFYEIFQIFSSRFGDLKKLFEIPVKELGEILVKKFPQKFSCVEDLFNLARKNLEEKTIVKAEPLPDYSLLNIQIARSVPEKSPTFSKEAFQDSKSGSPEFSDFLSPDPMVSFFALLGTTGIGWGKEKLSEFEMLCERQVDQISRLQIELIIGRVKENLQSGSSDRSPLSEIEKNLNSPKPDYPQLFLTIESLNRRDGQIALSIFRGKCWNKFPWFVIPFCIQFIKKFGSAQDGPVVEGFVRNPDPRVGFCALEALEKLNIDDLKPHIIYLLTHPNPALRARGIRLLYKWDRDEALRHFEANLFSQDRNEQKASLYNAYFLPFLDIEPFLIKFIGTETEIELLRQAGSLFRANPVPEEPLRLVEVLETSSGEKAKFIGDLLQSVVESLYKAGIVEKKPQEIISDITKGFHRKKGICLADHFALGLQSQDREVRAEAVSRIETLHCSGFPEIKQVLEMHFPRETDLVLKSRIESCLSKPKEPATSDQRKIDSQSTNELSKILPGLDKGSFEKNRSLIQKDLEKIPDEEKISFIHFIGKFGEKSEIPILRKLIKSASPGVISATIEALFKIDREELIHHLPKLVQHPAIEVREASLRIYILEDKKQALTFVEQMLGSSKVRQREAGLFAAGFFDFPSVEDLLLRHLSKENDQQNVHALGIILKANLTKRLFARIIEVLEESPKPQKEFLEPLVQELSPELLTQANESPENVQNLIENEKQKVKIEQETKKKNFREYSLQNVQKIRAEKKIEPSGKTGLDQGEPGSNLNLWKLNLFLSITCIFLSVAVWSIFGDRDNLNPGASEPQPDFSSPKSLSLRDKPLENEESRDVQGVVVMSFIDGVSVILEGTNQELFVRYAKKPRPYPPGSPFRAKIKPIKVTKGSLKRIEADLIRVY